MRPFACICQPGPVLPAHTHAESVLHPRWLLGPSKPGARGAQLLTYLDRSSLAFAAPDMIADLGLDGASYGLGAGLLFVTYSALMMPGSMLVEALGAPTGLALATVAWGAITALTSLVRSAPAFYAVRLALGAAEACCFPGAALRPAASSEPALSLHGKSMACFCARRLRCAGSRMLACVTVGSALRRHLGALLPVLHRAGNDARLCLRPGGHRPESGARRRL